MVPSWAGAAGSAGLAAEPLDEKHNSIASPAVRERNLRMWFAPLGRI
jgi:hypothetical protein